MTTTKTLNDYPEFKPLLNAIRALRSTPILTTDVRQIKNSTDYQNLMTHLIELSRPFGIVITTLKEN
jgi:hypothetical protein